MTVYVRATLHFISVNILRKRIIHQVNSMIHVHEIEKKTFVKLSVFVYSCGYKRLTNVCTGGVDSRSRFLISMQVFAICIPTIQYTYLMPKVKSSVMNKTSWPITLLHAMNFVCF